VANIKSQIKRNRQNEKRHERNKAVRSEILTRTRQAVEAVTEGRDDAEETTRAAIKRIDSAVSKGILHKNTAARKKSRLVKRLARIEAERD
jgi:small subunit ribosomal protein S20